MYVRHLESAIEAADLEIKGLEGKLREQDKLIQQLHDQLSPPHMGGAARISLLTMQIKSKALTSKPMKPRKCSCGCGLTYEPNSARPFVTWVTFDCGVRIAQARLAKKKSKEAKVDRKEIRQRKDALKGRQWYLKQAQVSFNAWVRQRDSLLPCVSCGAVSAGQWDCSHYRSVGAMPTLRFHPDNCHRACSVCNQHKSGNILEYRLGLIKRIGLKRVEWLEGDHEPKKYTIEDAKAIRDEYRQRLKEMRR
jgi:hypothetical protein